MGAQLWVYSFLSTMNFCFTVLSFVRLFETPWTTVCQELAQTQVHRVGDAIQPSHPLLSPSPAFNLSRHQGLFQ